MSIRLRFALPLGMIILLCMAQPAAVAAGWTWPVRGPTIRGFEPPSTPFGAGHRGVDIAAPVGTPVLAPAHGVVSFAGAVAGHLFVTMDHGGGLTSTFSWVQAVLVRTGDAVAEGSPVALSGMGHPGVDPSHLHFGVRLDGAYVDPLAFLAPLDLVGLIRLAPIPPPRG